MPCIKPIVANHLEVLLGDMLDDAANEIKGRDGFFNIYVIFVAIVVEGDIFTIVFINT